MPALDVANSITSVAEGSNRRGKITDEHRRESAALKRLWIETAEARAARGVGTQETFGAEYGIGNQAAVGFFLNGKTALSVKAALGFARGLRCAVADFSPRLANLIEQAPPHDTEAAILSAEVLGALSSLAPTELRKAENLLRVHLGLDPLTDARAVGAAKSPQQKQQAAA